ncbi:MAG: hypothetical protein MUD01_08375 [Chloroflexaceae bacterium]|jgi:hypothetical protein|nr:hypothetical protein [Chloroflexaceae bacterium]
MYLMLRVDGQTARVHMDNAGEQNLTVGEYAYRPARMAQRVRKLATKMWGRDLTSDVLDQRLVFEALDGNRAGTRWGDSGSFTPATGSTIALGRWDEDATVGIALHELAHEMHMRQGGYDDSDGVIREALSLLAEREAGLVRTFEREPYYTASNLVTELCELGAFSRMGFGQRWAEVVALTSDTGLADLVNFYLDRDEHLGLTRWLKRFSERMETRDALLNAITTCSLRYSLDYRRALIKSLVRCNPTTPLTRLYEVLDAVMTLDKRYPDDDLSKIIDFCFAPLVQPRRGLLAFGA